MKKMVENFKIKHQTTVYMCEVISKANMSSSNTNAI